MNIASICQRDVITVEADASLRQAATLMRDHHVGALVVIDGIERPSVAGVVTDRDLAIEVLATDLDPDAMVVGQLVAGPPVAVPGSASLQDAVALMEQRGVRRLLVTGSGGGVIGLVSVDDVVDAMATGLGGLARALRSGIAREQEERSSAAARLARGAHLPPGIPRLH